MDAAVAQSRDEDEPVDADDISLHMTLRTPSFEGFEAKRMTYLYTTQLTCSNVMSTVTTARPLGAAPARRLARHESPLTPAGRASNQVDGGTASHVYAQPCNPKKAKKNARSQAQLPALRRSSPALPIPIARLNDELRQERNKFMKQLQQEREEKRQLENWAATKIQACYRGFRARPRVLPFEARQKLNTLSSIRMDLTDMEGALPAGPPPRSVSPWRQGVERRVTQKRDALSRRELAHRSATVIQSCVKRFLAKLAYAQLLSRHLDDVFISAVIKIQSVFRGYRLRDKMLRIVTKLQNEAAVQIQCLIRGVLARERVNTLRFEAKCEAQRRAGEALQFTLPKRTKDIVRTWPIQSLLTHRKTRAQLEFRGSKWNEERMYLQIHPSRQRSRLVARMSAVGFAVHRPSSKLSADATVSSSSPPAGTPASGGRRRTFGSLQAVTRRVSSLLAIARADSEDDPSPG
ncbi:hypothetical protein P43SY_000577 [Pythium insidiosum]|uniref:Uncharacterized protein n=1 Tax=Pythium insidiosum TaxID=114742 RepID=A0AAD5LV69_PYTIN|nr:hypothetical protein P43SY_000577 [Pythium insidiosum]